MSKYPNGSEWRKWDLHIHTPASFHWQGGKSLSEMTATEKDECIKYIVEKMNSLDVAVFSIMDYFTFDGVLAIRDYLKRNPSVKLEKTLFPGMEIRVEAPVDFRLNIHVIFSESVTDQELNDFKNSLIIGGTTRGLSTEAMIAAARSLQGDKARECGTPNYQTDDAEALTLACKTVKITRESFFKAADALGKEKCLVLLPYGTSDGISKLNWKTHPHEAYFFMRNADIFESRNKDQIDLFLNVITENNKDFIADFQATIGGKAKPVISGSDAHKVGEYGSFPNGKATWVKADPTFRGLLKTTIEPGTRTFIGDRPEKLKIISAKSTKFISRLEIRKKADAKIDEVWFDNQIPLNQELVAIIGNKGSGKSALSDIIGLLGNSRQEQAFSFLHEKKFREKQGYKADKFSATVHWTSLDTATKSLSENIDKASVETVRYIPQSFLEKLCNEITSEASLFDQELKAVIFSHITEDQRLGINTLDALIAYKTEETNHEIEILRDELKTVVDEILGNENKLSEGYKQTLVNQLSSRQAELQALSKAKPEEVAKPIDDGSTNAASQMLLKELEEVQKEEARIVAAISQKKSELESLRKKKTSAEKAVTQIDIIERQYRLSVSQLEVLLKDLGIAVEDIFSFEISKQKLNACILEVNSLIEGIGRDFDLQNPSGLSASLVSVQSKIKDMATKVDEPNQKYQKYSGELESWNRAYQLIQGDPTKPGTISYLTGQISEIKNIPVIVSDLETKRDTIVSQIYGKVSGLAETYRQFYAPVQEFVTSNPFGDDAFKMSFDVSIVDHGFKAKFFPQLNRNRSGSFHGIEESDKFLNKVLDKYDFNKTEDVKGFTREILSCLKHDRRDDKLLPVTLAAQVKDPNGIANIYYDIFSLDYLQPKYSLRLNGKSLEQLSPGERGTLLLIFYLMVDMDDRPLVVDQPEENLDNHTIFKVLVPCIKKAKKHRQIFLVTHNPNLAVVCDAEQVVVAMIDKANKNTVSYKHGSIESPEVNQLIVDILEGTRPAFDNRDSKYFSKGTAAASKATAPVRK